LVPDELVPNKAAREAVDGHLRDWARRRNEPVAPETHEEDEGNAIEMLEDPLVVNNNVDLSVEKDTTESLNELMIKTEEKEKSTSGLSETVLDNAENSSQSPQISKAKVESNSKTELPKKPTHDLPPIPQSQIPTHQSQSHSSQSQHFQQSQMQRHQYSNAAGKSFGQNPITSQGYGPFAGYYSNDYGFGYDQNQGYWYDEGYPPMSMNMMNGPGYYDPSYFDSGFYPADPFPSQPQFMPHFRPPVYDEFWDNRPMIPPQGNFVPFAGNMGNGMGGNAGMQPFRGGNFRGGFSRGNFPSRARGRGRGSPGFFNDRSSFTSGRSDFRRESSVPPSIGRRDMSDYRDDETKYEDDRLVDDFGRDLARRKSSASRVSAERDIEPRDKKSPSHTSDRDRRDREAILDGEIEDRRLRDKAPTRSRSKERSRRSRSRSRHQSSRRHRDDSRHSRSPSRHDRSSPDRRKASSSRRRSRSREAFLDRKDERRYSSGRYYDDRRYSMPEKREERRDSNLSERRDSRRDSNLSDKRGDRRNSVISERRDDRRDSKSERRDDRRESYSSRYEKPGSINERRDPKHDSMDDRKEENRNNSLSNERFDYEDSKNRSRTRSPEMNHENGKSEYHSPNLNIDTDVPDDRVSPPASAEQLSEDIDRRTRSRSPSRPECR